MIKTRTTEFRVVSESEGYITEYGDKLSAKKRAEELNAEHGLPSDHYVEEHTEVF